MTHYEALGLDSGASYADIKKAFRKLASLHHPDKNGNVEKMAQVNAAWAVLGDAEAKRRYDLDVEDELGESIIESRAMEVLAGTFESLLEREFYREGGIVAAANAELQARQMQILEGLREGAALSKKLKHRAGGVRMVSDDLNLVQVLCAKRLDSVESRARALREHLMINKRARSMLGRYEDVIELRPRTEATWDKMWVPVSFLNRR